MSDFLERLQSMSLAKRRSIVVSVSTLVTLFIFGVWLLTFTREKSPVVAQEFKGRIIVEDQSASPFRSMGRALRDLFDGTTQEYERP